MGNTIPTIKKHLKVLKKQPWHDLKVGDYVIPTEILFRSSLIGKVCQVVTVEPLTYTGNLPIKIQELESGSYAWCKEFTPVTTCRRCCYSWQCLQ